MVTNKREILARGALLLSCLSMGVAYSGCAQDVGTIDRTRPDKLKKSIFSGDDEWYYGQTVVGSDFQSSHGLPVGYRSSLKRIRWTITEDTLFAYSTTEPAIGVDNGLQDPKDRRLGVVAAFPIISHFDIQRGYNSSTGQLSNVVEENGSDRLWYDREYMRVDWSGNRIGGVGLFESGIGKMSAVNRTVPSSDSSADYDRSRISDDYIDVVTEYYFKPDPMSCALGLGRETYMNCEAGPVKIRSAFLKVPKKRKFEPVPYFDYEELKDDDGQPLKVANVQFHQVACTPDIKRSSYRNGDALNQDACLGTAKFDLFNRFGFFRTERTIYDARRGSKYLAEKRYFANSWNIWQTAYDDKGNLLPMEERKPKQIIYYLNVDFPEDKPYTEAWKALEQDWNKVFLNTVKLTHNIVDLKGGSVYNWMSALIDKMDKIDKKVYEEGSGTVDVENITPRLGLDGNGEVIEGSPLFYAGKAIEAMKANGGAAWTVLCSDGLFTSSLGLGSSTSCESSDVDQLVAKIKTAIGKEAAKYASSIVAGNPSWDLANLPLTQSLLLLARTYLMTPVDKQLPQAKATDVKKYELAVRRSVSASKYRKEIPRTTFQSGDEAVKKLIAASNGGDERMFRIEPNSCSPVKLMQWKSQYGDINEDVQSLFSGQTVDSLRKLTRKGKLEFCAKLEWATRDEQGGRRFDWQREGDLRYSFVSMTPETVPWLGYGPAFADPQTGEIISAAANFAGEAVSGYAALAADYIMYFDGRISEDELITGDFVTKELDKLAAVDGTTTLTKLRPGQLGEVPAGGRQALSLSSRQGPEVLRELYAKAGWGENGPVVTPNTTLAPLSKPELQKKVADLAKSLRSSDISSKALALEYRRFLKLQDQKAKQIAEVSSNPKVVAAHLTSPEYAAMLDALGKARYGDRELTQDERDSIIAEVSSPILALRREDARSRELASHNFYPVEALEQGLGTAISYQGSVEYFKNKSRKEIEDYFKKGVFFGTQVHEVGHTLGLRHNFIGSYDAINYQPAFWDVKAAGYNDPAIADTPYLSGEQLEQITGEKPPGTTDYFNRAAYRYSSIMDYTVGFNSGVPGVGTYDEAAIQFVYAKRIQVFDDSVDWDPLKTLFINKLFLDYNNFPTLFLSNRFLTAGKEDQLPPFLGGFYPLLYDLGAFGSMHDQDKVRKEYFPAAIKLMTKARRWVTVDEAKQDFKDQLKRRAEVFTKMLKKDPDGVLGQGDLKRDVLSFLNKEPRLNLVPYKFCTDDFRGVELGCDVFDWGASQDEILQYKIDRFETLKNRSRYNHGVSNQLFQNYRNYYFGLSGLLYSVQQPFFYYANVVVAKGLNWFNATKDYQRASLRGLNYIAKTFAQPEPDKYCPFDSENPDDLTPANPDLYVAYSEITDSKGDVVGCDNPLIITKNEGVAYSYKIADTYNLQLERLPGYIDKDLAIRYMFLVTGTYLNQELNNDATSDKGSFWTAFQDQVYDFLRGVVLSDPKGYAGGVDVSSGTPKYVPPQLVSYADLEAYDDNEKPAPNPEEALPRVDVFANFTMGYDALLYSLILNNTYLDDQGDAIQYMKVCASNDECDNIYLDIDNGFSGTVTAPDGTTANYKNGRKLVSYELKEPTPAGTKIATITDAPSTTYRTATGIIVKTFVHPDLPIIFRVPIARDGKSIAGDLVDKLNNFVYGAPEPSYAAVLSRGDKKEATGLYIYKRNDYENFMKNEPAGTKGYKEKKQSFERARRLMEFYVSKLNVIREIMKNTRGLY